MYIMYSVHHLTYAVYVACYLGLKDELIWRSGIIKSQETGF